MCLLTDLSDFHLLVCHDLTSSLGLRQTRYYGKTQKDRDRSPIRHLARKARQSDSESPVSQQRHWHFSDGPVWNAIEP